MNKIPIAPRFEGYCYICQSFGHREYECRSQPQSIYTKKRWRNKRKKVYSNCHKIGNVNKNCMTRAPVANNEHNKGKGKVDVE